MLAAATHSLGVARLALTERLRQAGIESADVDARMLIAEALGIGRTELMVNGDRAIDAEGIAAIERLAARRLRHEPVARILGRKDFWSLSLQVTPAVLVPRPETETVIEAALDFVVRGGLRIEKLRILDIGTGSGALLLALLSELPNATGTGTDISEAALQIARVNAAGCALESRCNFVVCDIASGVQGPFDLVVSNPPYVAHDEIASLAPEVREYDPAVALDGGRDGLDAYRIIAGEARRLLAPGGRLFVEFGAGQEPPIRALFTKAGLTVGTARTDLTGIERAIGAGAAP